MTTRRQWLTAAAYTGMALWAEGVQCLPAMEPLNRKGPSKLRLSLAAYSLRKYLTLPKDGGQPQMNLFDFVDYCQKLGISGVELTSYYFPPNVTEDYLAKLRLHCHRLGMTISGGAIRNDFCSSEPKRIEQDLAHTRQWVDHYMRLGAPAIRIFAGNQPSGESLSDTLARCARNCEAACEYAKQRGILLALENHGGVTAKAEDLLQIVKQVNSDAFGINFDSGNFHSTDDPYQELALIAPFAINAQIKVEMHIGGKSVPADLARITQILRAAKYSGWVALEYEASEEPLEAIPGWLSQLSSLMDG